MHSTAFFVWGVTTADPTFLTTLLIGLATIGACYLCCGFEAAVFGPLEAWSGDLEVAFAAVISSIVRPVLVVLG